MYSVYLQSVESFWKLSLLHISESKTPRHIFTSSSLLPLLLSSPLLFFSLLLSSPHLLFSPLLLNFYTFLLSFPLSISPVSPPLLSSSPFLSSSHVLSSPLLLWSPLVLFPPLLLSSPFLLSPPSRSSRWFLCDRLVPLWAPGSSIPANLSLFGDNLRFLRFLSFLFSFFCQFLSISVNRVNVEYCRPCIHF